ncbi:hypothetical protein JOY44_09665 [Phormidium sp. CLA17]|uniref:hypothetical protein n=1 Tax=Leptolyngbya sp. Cla-17 TaxID=2803751 RepID=UPI0014911E82|nr:hypothetical protein [Leptolyngbya sp. Cla-17]MBM0741887.1 hypothetical protein [Leptolyngbya sp. Cla-17]
MYTGQRLWLSRSTKWIFRLSLMGGGLGLAIAFMYLSYASPPLRQVKISEVINLPNGSGAQVEAQKAEKGNSIRSGQQLITPQFTRVGIQEASGAARLGANSSLIVRNDCFQLGGGKAVIANAQGCIGAIVVSTANGIYTVERLGYLAEVKVLAGQVDLSIPSNPAINAVSLQPNQKVTVNWTGDEIGPVRLMLPQEVTAIANGELFQGFQVALPNQNKVAALQRPVATRETVPPAPPKPTTSVKPPPAPVTPQPPPAPTAPDYSQIAPASARGSDYSTDDSNDAETYDSPAYSRHVRRRASPNFSDERYTYRRRGRSPYASNSYRRRTPSYSAPSYSDSSDEAPSAPSAPPVMEQPHPVETAAPPMVEAPLPMVIEQPVSPLPVVPEGSVVVPGY